MWVPGNQFEYSRKMKNINLPKGDRTPLNFRLLQPTFGERLKRPVRRIVYPWLNLLASKRLKTLFGTSQFSPNTWLWGQRGNDYATHRRRVNNIMPVIGKDLLIAGCGTGRDIESWLEWNPRSVVGIDYFDYSRAWGEIRSAAGAQRPSTSLCFIQGDLECLTEINSGSIDIVGSDAVFEHVRNLSAVLSEFYRVLRPGGLLYATFGPLWYCWGGDHVSGTDHPQQGYDHLLLSELEYESALNRMGQFMHSEDDARTWINNKLFSYLKPYEYVDKLEKAGFSRKYVGAIIEPRAVECLRTNPAIKARLICDYDLQTLVVTGMTIVYGKSFSQ